MQRHTYYGIGAALALAVSIQPSQAVVVPHPLFTDGVVLQQKLSDPIFGTADPGEKVTVSLQGQNASTVTGEDGNWTVRLKPLKSGGPYTLTIAGATNTVTVNDVSVGEVWVCSGQSNMEFGIGMDINSAATVAAAGSADVHLFTVPKVPSLTPLYTITRHTSWAKAAPDTLLSQGTWKGFSAVGYYFGLALAKSEHVPIGLIQSSWGGTTAQAWTSRIALAGSPILSHYDSSLDTLVATYPDRLTAYQAQLPTLQQQYADDKAKYDADAATAKANNQPLPRAPKPPTPPGDPANQPLATELYNGMITSIAPFGIRGAIWYQGEANTNQAWEYKTLLPTMIENWRGLWNEGPFPFYIVQLAPFQQIRTAPGRSAWAELREAQSYTASSERNSGIAVITDVGDTSNIHPKRKQQVGDRLAFIAQANVYGENVPFSGPTFSSLDIEGNKATLLFSNATGLTAGSVTDGEGIQVATPDKLIGFSVAGADQVFYNADAKISGSTVIVSSASVQSPVAVRYGWDDYPTANLENGVGLWTSPFRTDTWPEATQPTPAPPVAPASTPTPMSK